MEEYTGKTLEEAAAQFVKQYEGFVPVAVWDVNAYRAGHGSDTITFADGTFRKIVKGDTVTMAQADLDLARRIKAEFFPKVEKQIGSDAFASLADESIIALVDIAYNYGSLTKKKIIAAAKTGDNVLLAAVIVASTLNDNMGLEKANGWTKAKADKVRNALKARRKKESDLILNAVSHNPSTERVTHNVIAPPAPPSSGGWFLSLGKISEKIMYAATILLMAYCVMELIFIAV